MSKQYGLIIPNKNKGHQIGQLTTRPSIFDEDSDSDAPQYKPTGITKGIKKQDIINQEKAVVEDPTVFQYDEIYDDMDQKRKESKLSRKDLDRKPKYINKLLAAAEKRKRENERRIERQVQKEREEEGDLYKDKESFITSAYKKKLEEMKELEEQEKREDYLENIGDVRKQGNLDGFYRHLYDQKLNYEDKAEDTIKKETIKEEAASDTEEIRRESSEEDDTSPSRKRKSSEKCSENDSTKLKLKKESKQRKYRARRNSEDSNKSDAEEVKKEHLPSNLDADSDFSIDSDSDEEKKENTKKAKEKEEVKLPETSNEEKEDEPKKEKLETAKQEVAEKEADEKPEIKPKKPKIDIWKKRTVGEKYDEAVKRYFERKALRELEQKGF